MGIVVVRKGETAMTTTMMLLLLMVTIVERRCHPCPGGLTGITIIIAPMDSLSMVSVFILNAVTPLTPTVPLLKDITGVNASSLQQKHQHQLHHH